MAKTATSKKMDVADRKSAEPETNESSFPLWKEQEHRVKGAVWKRLQNGKPRFTVSISRSFKDKTSDKWKNVHYYDEKDLDDVIVMAQMAKEEILRQKDLAVAVGED
jgi:hypothetical protein